jgi:hypothetical protein
MAEEKEQGLKSLSESEPQANRPERKLEGFSGMRKVGEAAAQLKPLGLRYSFVVRRSDGQEQEVVQRRRLEQYRAVRVSPRKPIRTPICRSGRQWVLQHRNCFFPKMRPGRFPWFGRWRSLFLPTDSGASPDRPSREFRSTYHEASCHTRPVLA